MPSSLGAARRTSDLRRPRRPQPAQHPHDRRSSRADRLGRGARRRPRPRPGDAPQRCRSRRRGTLHCRASVGRMGSRRLLGRRALRQAACRSSSGLSSSGIRNQSWLFAYSSIDFVLSSLLYPSVRFRPLPTNDPLPKFIKGGLVPKESFTNGFDKPSTTFTGYLKRKHVSIMLRMSFCAKPIICARPIYSDTTASQPVAPFTLHTEPIV